MTRRPGASVSISTMPPVAVVGCPDALRGVEGEPVDGPAQPRGPARDGGHGKKRYARAGRKVQPQPGRREEDDVTLADHDAPVSGPRDQRVKHGKFVVEPRAGEAHGEHERHVQMPQAPCRNPCCPVRRPRGPVSPRAAPGPERDRIEIADDGNGHEARGNRRIRAAIDRHQGGPIASAASRSASPERPAPDQSDRCRPETTGCSGGFFWSSTATISIEWPYSRRVLLESSWSGQQQSDTVR
jgi:hypothetical protein